MEGDGERWKGEKEIRQKKRGDARWMRFHRGPSRRFVLFSRRCRGGGAERKYTENAEQQRWRGRRERVGGGRGGRERRGEGSCDAGRPVIAP